MNARATAAIMRLRRCTVERPFSVLKHVIFGNARFLLRGLTGAQTEISLATMAYNLKTMISVLGIPIGLGITAPPSAATATNCSKNKNGAPDIGAPSLCRSERLVS